MLTFDFLILNDYGFLTAENKDLAFLYTLYHLPRRINE